MANVSDVTSYSGTTDNDLILGTNGRDTLAGAGGNDTLNGGEGDDEVWGGADNDLLEGGIGNDTLNGEAGVDTLNGGPGNDTIRGGDGNDVISGEGGNDALYGDDGDDSISGGNGDDFISGGTGQNTLNGGSGFDLVSYFVSSTGVVVNLGGTQSGSASNGRDITDTLISIESIRGSLFSDTITGSRVSENFEARGGKDIIDGKDGTDRLIFNEAKAGVYVDLVAGVSRDAADALNGTTSDAADVGVDTFTNIEIAQGSPHADYLSAAGFGTTLGASNISSSRSTFNVLAGGMGNDTFVGNGNTELQFNFSNATSGVIVDLKTGTAESDWFGSDTLFGAFSSVVGTKFDDIIKGTNLLNGGESFTGGAGNDTFIGGGGYDSIYYANSLSSIQVDLEAGLVYGGSDVGIDRLSGIEAIVGSNFNDSYKATNFALFALNTNAPDDGLFNSFEGRGGNDTILGNGATRIVLQSSAGVWINALEGRAMDLADYQNGTTLDAAGVGVDNFSGVNHLRGGAYADVLIGGKRESNQFEVYEGRGGNDSIYGGSGYDRVNYRNDGRSNGGFIDGTDGTLLFGYDENGERIYTVGIDVRMAKGFVYGDEKFIGTDQLSGIESVRGTVLADRYDATGFGANSANSGSSGFFNDFEGYAGNDTIIGNGYTDLRYEGAAGAIYVNLAANASFDLGDQQTGSTTDLAMIGIDVLGNGINAITGSKYGDLLIGGRTENDLLEAFSGGRGDDTISGGSGFDRARYHTAASRGAWLLDGENLRMLDDGLADSTLKFSKGVSVNLASGIVVGDANWIGTDTLLGIESVFGTILADTYDATDFSGISDNSGAFGTFNEFQGFAGNDLVIGNGNTRVSYIDAYAGVFVDLANGTSSGSVPGDAALVGVDKISGVNAVRGSNFGDVLIGSKEGDLIEGMGGDDSITGGAGNDRIDGGVGRDTAVYAGDLSSVISIGRSADGLSVVIKTTNEGTDTLTNIENIQFGLASAMSVQDAQASARQAPVFSSVKVDLNATRSDGAESSEGSAQDSTGAAAQAVDTTSALIMPEVYTGPVKGIDYQLIDTTPDAVIVGSTYNDFIVLQGTGNKAVNGGGGDNVIDGGTGSTFITGGGVDGSDTFFLDGRATGTSWSTITDFELGLDKATIWGWKEGVSSVLAVDAEGGATGYTGLTLHFKNLLPDDASTADTNESLNSITLSGRTLADFGASSLADLNAQITAGTNSHFIVGQTVDAFGEHGYLFLS
jgi:Ca2+-binding RTX toxin-like protein